MAVWYCGSVHYAAVAQFAINHAYSVGDIVRQLAAPTAGNERCFRCTTAGTSAASEPVWNLTKGSTTTSGGATFTEVTGNSTYNWSAPHNRIANAAASGWAVAGDTIYVASTHNYSVAASFTITFTASSSQAFPIKVICVNAAGSVPPVSADITTGAKESTTGNASLTITSGCAFIQGLTFQASNSTLSGSITIGSGNPNAYVFKNCALILGGTTTTNLINISNNSSGQQARVELINTTMQFAATAQSLVVANAQLLWRDTPSAIAGATLPTTLLGPSGNQFPSIINFDGVDLSAMGSGKTLIGGFAAPVKVSLTNCKLNASVTVAGTQSSRGSSVHVVNSDSGATGYRQEKHEYNIDLTTETTIVRTGGASDGVQALSWKVVTGANAEFTLPFETFPIAVWNSATGSSKTATVEIVSDNVTFNNDEVWLEVHYLGSSATPIASTADNAKADVLATAAAQTSSSATWTTTGLTTPVKQKLQVSFTPQMAGYVRCLIKCAKASATFYVDPVVTIS